MTELAIVLPVLLLVVFAILQLGIVFNNYVTLTDAVRAGARRAAVSRQESNPSSATIAKVQSAAGDLNLPDLSCSVNSDWVHGDDVTVNCTYPYSINLLGYVVQAGRLSSTTTERVE